MTYLINPDQDGKVEIYVESLHDVTITGIVLYAVEDDQLLYVANSYSHLIVEDVAAGLYQVKITGNPINNTVTGGTFVAGYVLTPADYVNDPEPNNTWERAYQIESGNVQHGHLGYKRAGNRDEEDWFKIVVPDEGTVTFTTHTSNKLCLSYLGMYTLKADGTDVNFRNDKWMNGEGKDTTIVYEVFDCKPGTYYVRVRRTNGYGDDSQEGNVQLATNIGVMTEGRNTVRKGVPCENPITISNLSSEKSGKFLVSITATDNIDIIGFRLPKQSGAEYLSANEVTVADGADCEHTILFYVPSLDPWESYTFTMISEGKGDIAYAPSTQVMRVGMNNIVVNSNTFAVVTALGNVSGADEHINVDDYLVHRIGDVYDLTGEQRLKLSQLMEQLDGEKHETGLAAYSVLQLLQRASELCGMDLLDATCPIATYIRQYVLHWIFQDDDVSDFDIQMDILDGKAAITDVVASWDPNEMVGPAGVGEEHYLGDVQTVSYRILFENKATIIFDKNFPIETNEFVNTLDLTPPVSTMAQAYYQPKAGAVHVSFSATDDASGVQSYLLFGSKNGGDYAYYGQSFAPEMSCLVDAVKDDAFSFFVLAIDNVGNVEKVQPQSIDALTTGISDAACSAKAATLRIYSTDGRYVGSDPTLLPKGIYMIGGSKYVVK